VHHIILRGIERRRIFRDDFDRENFLERLERALTETQTACYAWALMPNHIHLLLKTGSLPMAAVMRRLLTGYAVSFNLRHRRHGHLFQNRYKSILCQEDAYLKELVRYIHLNPLRAKAVASLEALEKYPWCGHAVILGAIQKSWHDADYVLRAFAPRTGPARRIYLEFVEAGAAGGRSSKLTGGGLIRSAGGWQEVKALRHSGLRIKSDERILGDGDFVSEVMSAVEAAQKRRYALKARGVTFGSALRKAAQAAGVDPAAVIKPGKQPAIVKARRLLCYCATRELGMSATEVGRRVNLTQSAVSRAAAAGEKLALEIGFLLEGDRSDRIS
jgi:REP element-mobilizing transposase RayT